LQSTRAQNGTVARVRSGFVINKGARHAKSKQITTKHWFIYIYGRLRLIRAVITRGAFSGLVIRLTSWRLAGFGWDNANPDALGGEQTGCCWWSAVVAKVPP
jgi:hypothetical protein